MNRIGLAVCFAALTGCVAQKPWRTKSPASPGGPAPAPTVASTLAAGTLPVRCPEAKPDRDTERRFVIPPDLSKCRIYSLAFVEFNNSGQPAVPGQLDAALRAIDDADRRSGHHAMVITFIHGWKNNARENNNNVNDFRLELNRIAWKACQGAESRCGVTGIYMAWNGDLVKRYANATRTLTIFNRMQTAEQVALAGQPPSQAALAPIGNAVLAVMKQVKAGSGDASKTNHSVVVGHSLGGLILEYALYSRLEQIGRELGNSAAGPALADFADLVVLINQAAPADHAVNLISQYLEEGLKTSTLPQACWWDGSLECPHPLVLSVASATDLATKTILPIAEAITPSSKARLPLPAGLPKSLDPTTVYHTGTAHANQLQSHVLNPVDCGPNRSPESIRIHITLPAYAPSNTTPAPQPIDYCLVPNPDPNAWDRTPYWAFEIPTAIVPDHGTIFTDRFVDFLAAFLPPLELYNPMLPPPPPRLQARPAERNPNR